MTGSYTPRDQVNDLIQHSREKQREQQGVIDAAEVLERRFGRFRTMMHKLLCANTGSRPTTEICFVRSYRIDNLCSPVNGLLPAKDVVPLWVPEMFDRPEVVKTLIPPKSKGDFSSIAKHRCSLCGKPANVIATEVMHDANAIRHQSITTTLFFACYSCILIEEFAACRTAIDERF